MRWMGLDVGERRIGIAFSDPLGITAQAYAMRERTNLKADLFFLRQLFSEKEATGIVVGLPINMNGSAGPMAEKARAFGAQLAKTVGVTPFFWDERLSTTAAERILLEADLSRSKRRQKIDQLAASVILQNFLDYRNRINPEQ